MYIYLYEERKDYESVSEDFLCWFWHFVLHLRATLGLPAEHIFSVVSTQHTKMERR